MTPGSIINNRYRLERPLGRGSFGEVWLATDRQLAIQVAIKVYVALDSRGIEEFKGEFKSVYNLRHPNLLRSDYFDSIGNNPYLVMPYCPDSAGNMVGSMPEGEIWRFVRDVAGGLAYLHDNDVIHRDIKPDNILRDAQGNYVITDFGLSTRMRSTLRRASTRQANDANSSSGTIAYMAPELFSADPQAVKASDIWALGVTIYELATGELPFCGQGGIMELNGAELPELPDGYSRDLNTLMQTCLAHDAWDRPRASQIVDIAQCELGGQSYYNRRTGGDVVADTVMDDEDPELKQRNGCVTVWLWLAMLGNIGITVYYVGQMFEVGYSSNALGFGFCSILGCLNILGAVLLLRWQKCGFYLFAISTLVAIVINLAVLGMPPEATVSSLVAIAIWRSILQAKKDGQTAWYYLDSGWNFARHKTIYWVATGLCSLLFVLTFYNYWRCENSIDDYYSTPDDYADEEVIEEVATLDDGWDSVVVCDSCYVPESVDKRKPETNDISSADRAIIRDIQSTSFPVDCGDGLTMTSIVLEGNYVVYTFECDEDEVDIDDLNSSKSVLKATLMSEFGKSDDDTVDMRRMCLNAHKGIKFKYIGDRSRKVCLVTVSYQELRGL